MTDRIFLRPPDWESMTEAERFAWSLAFVRAAVAAWRSEEPDPNTTEPSDESEGPV